ncbi:MAG: glycosyltransferase family 9 protein [Cytophagaceae bacterium]
MPKVLIIRFSSIGDIVLTSPVVRNLKQQKADFEVHFLTKKIYASLIEHNPYVDKAFYLEDNLKDVITELKEEQYDYIIDLHKNLRSLKVKTALKAKSYSFNKLNIEKWLLVNFKWNKMPAIHIVDRYMETLKELGVINDQKGLDFFIPENRSFDFSSLPLLFKEGYVAFAIGGQHGTKKLPTHKIAELCQKIKRPVILLGGKEDMEGAEKVISLLPPGTCSKTLNLTGKLSLFESASLVRDSQAVVTHDTGLMHIAAAFKKKVYSIWGNTVPELGMYPYKTEHVLIQNNNLSCRPCSKIGYDQCPKKHFKCMEDLTFDDINL